MKRVLAAAALAFLAQNARAADVLKWAWEDANNDGVFNYSVVNWNFQSANQWNNFAMSSDAYQGKTSLAFKYLNQDLDQNGSHTQAFGYTIIPTSYAGDGNEPNSMDEYNAGKDLSTYKTLEFFVKGSAGANQSALNVWLRSPNGFSSVLVPLKNYVNVTGNWQKVSIPVSAFLPSFNNPNAFQINNVHGVGLYVTQNNANVPFDIKLDNISFIRNQAPQAPLNRAWWTNDANNNGEYNYSTTAYNAGSALNVANQYGDIKIDNYMTGPYGNSPVLSVDLHFVHNGTGYAEANLTTSGRDTAGHEPQDFADRDSGKAINPASILKFTSPGTTDGVNVKLVDAAGHSSKSVRINSYRGDYGRYTFDYSVPVSALLVTGFDINTVKSVTFFVDRSTPAGDYPVHLTVVKFAAP